MKKIILSQRIQYYEIEPFKDYCLLSKREDNIIHEDLNLDLNNIDFFAPEVTITEKVDGEEVVRAFRKILKSKHKVKVPNKNELKKKNTKYYYSDNPEGEYMALDPWSDKIHTFYTTKERHLLKHFGRPLSSVSTEIRERSLSMDDDTLSVRFYLHRKHRPVNSKFFKKTRRAVGFKINFKTGNIITYEGGERPKMRQNNFDHLEMIVKSFFGYTSGNLFTHLGNVNEDNEHPINKQAKMIFDDQVFIKSLSHILLSRFPHNKSIMLNEEQHIVKKVVSMIMETFISINKIGVPNEYAHLLKSLYPTKVFLKKNDNKLIAAVLDRLGIKSKGTVKLLHQNPRMNIGRLLLLAKYFSYRDLHKYMHNIHSNFFTLPSDKDESNFYGIDVYHQMRKKMEYDIKDSERKCLLKLLNEFLKEIDYSDDDNGDDYNEDGESISRIIKVSEKSKRASLVSMIRNQLSTFNDHLNILIKIRSHIPDTEMRAATLKDFHNEHLEFSKLDRAIKKGYSIEYRFDNKLLKHVEEPIFVRDERGELLQTYYPVILKIDSEYSEEGAHMHHCVASYADKERSIIVSLREGEQRSYERVTCEFDVSDKSCIQAKYFCNAKPPERFEFALEKLKHRIKIFRGSIKSISKEKIPLVINGVTIEVKEESLYENIFGDF